MKDFVNSICACMFPSLCTHGFKTLQDVFQTSPKCVSVKTYNVWSTSEHELSLYYFC